MHVEASCLPGDDAGFVYYLTTQAISAAQKLVEDNLK
jgi:hypothetical protein